MTSRGGVLIAAVLAVLAAPVALAASTATFKGAVATDENSTLTFKILRNDNGKRRVDLPKVTRVDALCDSGPREIDVKFGSRKDAKVGRDGSFEFDNSGADYIAYVTGDISRKTANGVLRFQGTVEFQVEGKPPFYEACDTGEVKWDAVKKASSSRARGARSAESSPSAFSVARP